MRQRLFVTLLFAIFTCGMFPVAAQNPEPTEAPLYDPKCAIDLMKAYMSGWEYDHRDSEGVIDVVVAAQVARNVYQAFDDTKVDCTNTLGGFKENLLRSMHGDYPAAELTRMIRYIEEAIGEMSYADCAYEVGSLYMKQVDWGEKPAIQVGRTISEVIKTVREVIPSGNCDAAYRFVLEILAQIEDIPYDSAMIGSIYGIVVEATAGHYISQYACNYIIAKTFFEKAYWDTLTSTDIVRVVRDAFKISYTIGSDNPCDSEPALAITALLLDDMYRLPPDASIIQRTYNAASGVLVATPEATAPPIVN